MSEAEYGRELRRKITPFFTGVGPIEAAIGTALVTPFAGQPASIPLPIATEGVPTATLSTGANVVGGDGCEDIAADLVDMETFAVVRACQRFGIPVLGLRGVSDGAGDLHAIGTWQERHMNRLIERPGLPADNPAVHCDADAVCRVAVGMGCANASASVAALVCSDRLDLMRTHRLVAGVAGINPRYGTLGTATWAHSSSMAGSSGS